MSGQREYKKFAEWKLPVDLRRPDSGFYTPDPIIHLRQAGTASAHTAEGQKPEADSVRRDERSRTDEKCTKPCAFPPVCRCDPGVGRSGPGLSGGVRRSGGRPDPGCGGAHSHRLGRCIDRRDKNRAPEWVYGAYSRRICGRWAGPPSGRPGGHRRGGGHLDEPGREPGPCL